MQEQNTAIKETDNNDIGFYGFGWAFYKSCGDAFNDQLDHATDDDIKEWLKGFLAAFADYEIENNSVTATLKEFGFDDAKAHKFVLLAQQMINESDEWIRLPSINLIK